MLKKPNIIIIIADSLPNDLPVLGYERKIMPKTAVHFSNAGVYSNCFATSGRPLAACASIMTGYFPDSHGLNNAKGKFLRPKISEYLQPDYQCIGIANNDNFGSDFIGDEYLQSMAVKRDKNGKRYGWDKGFDRYDCYPRADHLSPFMRAKEVINEQAKPDNKPFFMLLQTNIVHDYFSAESYHRAMQEWFDRPIPEALPTLADGPAGWLALREQFDDDDLQGNIRAKYDCGVLALDRQLHALFEEIDFSSTIVALVSDHGERFGPQKPRLHHYLVKVPLALWVPEPFAWQTAGIDGRYCSTVDLAPTILDLLAIDYEHLPGQSLLISQDPLSPPGRLPGHRKLSVIDRGDVFWREELQRQTYDGETEIKSTLEYPLKRIDVRRNHHSIHYMYNLAYDPQEQNNLFDEPRFVEGWRRISFVVAVNDWDELEQNIGISPIYRSGIHQWILVDNQNNEIYDNICELYCDAERRAEHELILYAHQDMYFPRGWERQFNQSLQQLEQQDPDWGMVGAVGVLELEPDTHIRLKEFAGHWSYPVGYCYQGVLPARVQSLDEQWLCIRKGSGLSFDPALPGFHCYGMDVCLQAKAKNMKCYAIDAFAWHKYRDSTGKRITAIEGSAKILHRFTKEFIAGVQDSYYYVGKKWNKEIPFCSTSMDWTDPDKLRYDGSLIPPPPPPKKSMNYSAMTDCSTIAGVDACCIIAGTGGSGTRVYRDLLEQAGVQMGPVENPGRDAVIFKPIVNKYTNSIISITQTLDYELTDLPVDLVSLVKNALSKTIDECKRQLSDDKIWGFKQPRMIYFLPFLKEIIPDFIFLHVVRDGRDMAYSANHNQLKNHFAALFNRSIHDPVIDSCRMWSKVNADVHAWARRNLSNRYLWLRFEDMCQNPRAEIERISRVTGQMFPTEAYKHISPPLTLGRWQRQAQDRSVEINEAARDGLELFGYLKQTPR